MQRQDQHEGLACPSFLQRHQPLSQGGQQPPQEDASRPEQMGSTPLLFLQETQRARSAAERRLINVHVQNDHHRKQQRASIRRLQSGTWKDAPNSSSKPSNTEDIHSNSPGRRSLRPAKKSASEHERRGPTSDENATMSLQSTRHSSAESSGSRTSTSRLSPSCLGVGLLDPFVMASIIPSNQANYVLTHYVKILIPLIYFMEVRARSATRQILQFAFSEPIVLHSLLAVASVQEVSPIHRDSVPLSPHASASFHLRHKLTSIQLINRAVANPSEVQKPSTLFAIWNAAVIETLTGSDKAEVMHLDGVDRILAVRGGFQGLPAFLVEILLSAFISRSAVTGEALRHMPPPPLGTISLRTASLISAHSSDHSDLLTGFHSPSLAPFVNTNILTIIDDLLDYTLFCEYLQRSDRDVPLQDHLIMNMKGLEIESGLITLRDSRTPTSPPFVGILDIVLLLFKDDLYGIHNPPTHVHREMTVEAKNILNSINVDDIFQQEIWNPLHDALVWIFTFCIYHSGGDSWYVKNLVRLVEQLGIQSWIQFEAVLKRFAYVPRIFKRHFRRIWQEVEGIRLAVKSLKETQQPAFRS